MPSPDGKSVAFAWYLGGNGRPLRRRARRFEAAGPSGGRKWDRPSVPIAWSPDGKHLLAAVAEGRRNLRHDAGRRRRRLGETAEGRGKSPIPGGDFSPDGRYIAWVDQGGDLAFRASRRERSLPSCPIGRIPSVLGWAPDGKHILFSSERSGSADAWLVAVAGGKAQGEPIFVKKNWGNGQWDSPGRGLLTTPSTTTSGHVKIAESTRSAETWSRRRNRHLNAATRGLRTGLPMDDPRVHRVREPRRTVIRPHVGNGRRAGARSRRKGRSGTAVPPLDSGRKGRRGSRI